MVRHAYTKRAEDDDFGQAGTLVRQVMSDQDRANLASNIVGHATNGEAGGSSYEHAPTNGGDAAGSPVGSGASTGL